jgi:hypothetical protein
MEKAKRYRILQWMFFMLTAFWIPLWYVVLRHIYPPRIDFFPEGQHVDNLFFAGTTPSLLFGYLSFHFHKKYKKAVS